VVGGVWVSAHNTTPHTAAHTPTRHHKSALLSLFGPHRVPGLVWPPLAHTEEREGPDAQATTPPGRTGMTIRRSAALSAPWVSPGVSLLRGLSPLPLQRGPPTTHHTTHHTPHNRLLCGGVVGGGEVAWLARKEPSQSGTNTLRKTGRTAVTQPPVVAKKRAWVVRTHSQFEDRLRSWAPQGWPLMRCFTGCNQSSTIFASLDPSYPEGNFEGNQLLGGSIGLSPLCRTQATQFARQNSDRLPPQFPMASS